jgi:hypothetical protein
LLPGVGFSDSLSQLLHGTAASMSCSLNLSSNPMCPSFIPAFAFAFVLANLTGYLACALVNKESATFSMVRERLQGCEVTQKSKTCMSICEVFTRCFLLPHTAYSLLFFLLLLLF